jgi:predicted NBD/HSP70 family sugar kinase
VSGVSRPDGIRRHNVALLLDSVHRHGPSTRAELTARLELNRSTIGVLVSDLCALGLVQETVPPRTARAPRAGRPSHVVAPRTDGPYAVAVDVEVDRLTAAAVRVGGELVARRVERLPPSRRSAASVARAIARIVDRLAEDMPSAAWPVGVGVSIPGTVSLPEGIVEAAPNLEWSSEPLGQMLADLLPPGTTVTLGNDADLGVLAEHLRGAARDAADVVYVNGKVGVGGGILVGGRPLSGMGGLAGEIGHTVFDPDGPPCRCGGSGCVENYIGEAALLRLAGRTDPPDAEAVSAVMRAARSGDPAACAGVAGVARSLGQVLANLVNLLNPQVIVLGGALADVLSLARTDIAAALDRQAMGAARRMVQIRTSGLGSDSSLLGAAELAFRPLLADPSAVVASRAAPLLGAG